jgi:hypothetical protein
VPRKKQGNNETQLEKKKRLSAHFVNSTRT